MPFPRILLAAPLLVAGILLPGAGAEPATPAVGVLGMAHEVFDNEAVTIRQGDTLTMVNNSRWVHIIGSGQGGHLEPTSNPIPVGYRVLMETDDSYTTGKWNTPGTYYLTCSVHPLMTVKVTVSECGCCGDGSC